MFLGCGVVVVQYLRWDPMRPRGGLDGGRAPLAGPIAPTNLPRDVISCGAAPNSALIGSGSSNMSRDNYLNTIGSNPAPCS